jgi:hypothetical protein
MIGLAILLATTHFGLPFWLNYIAAPLIIPSASPAMAAHVGRTSSPPASGQSAPLLKTAYAYENILEDVAFMVGPAAVIAVSAALVPAAGCSSAHRFCIGTVLLLSSKTRNPCRLEPQTDGSAKKVSVLRTSPVVCVLFGNMVLFVRVGAFDASAITYTESIDAPVLASVVFAVESAF